MHPVSLHASDLGIAALLVLLNAAISLALDLRLHRGILWSALRMVMQLLLVGLVLRTVFALASPAATAGIGMLMLAATAREVAIRPSHALRGMAAYRLAAVVVATASVMTALLALLTAIRPDPWYEARYALPILGIVLGSVLTSASLSLDTFLSTVVRDRREIEARLALGETIRHALTGPLRTGIRRGLIPVTNQMAAAGIITLPGTMTGQILAGMDPLEAVKYQILLLFLLAGASGLAAVGAVWLASRAVTDARQRLRVDRIIHHAADG
ncbi:ABC transporter permease [Noviherbaspirillum galbum]|uniref:ABC transporter permease n=1 Tax=Noviherbaspirillum galbum TaxID=2709383 RepID=A0A6B3SH52_9BURK|nr:ABC transporter permease [Noviherbaspirillum galbum]NEX59963.1 ABC transporter permease [Noviherbaspirillum galbum]